MIVYKFRALRTCQEVTHASDLLQNSRCFMAAMKQLNDPMEGYLHRFDPNETGPVHEEIENYGICSFSRWYSNTLLWSYYADGFNGICIAVEVEDKFLYSVRYDDEVTGENDPIAAPIEERAIAALTRKFTYWRQEAEIRAIARFSDLEDQKFLPCRIEGVLFGKKIDPGLRQLIEKVTEPGIPTDTVTINPGIPPHPCDGVTYGVRPQNLHCQGWLHVGAGHLSAPNHPAHYCAKCGCTDTDVLEEHYIFPIENGEHPSPQNTEILCANCHRRKHRT